MIRDMHNGIAAGGGEGQQGSNKPTRKQIGAAVQETYDRLWFTRHVELGRPAAGEKSALMIETKYGKSALSICDECELRLEGRLGALRWVLYGTAIDNYDT